jgi:tRNA nucleotidyltransferase (CCA-adding enzyme)
MPDTPPEPHPKTWEHFSHVADIGVRGSGRTVAEAFVQAALATVAVMADPAQIEPRAKVVLSAAAPDLELLLAEWLNALIYEMSTRRMLFSRFAVEIAGTRLTATAWGEPVDRTRHELGTEVKGATLTALRVAEEQPGRWVAQCVVDV